MYSDIGYCSKCKGPDSCSKCCSLHTGRALYDFIRRVDVIETRIGELSSRQRGGVNDLIVSGHQLFDKDGPCWSLTDITTQIDTSPKLNNSYDKSAVQLLMDFCAATNVDISERNELKEKLLNINKNKLIILPLKPGSLFKVDVPSDKDVKSLRLKYIKWQTNKETYKLDTCLGFVNDVNTADKTVKYSLEDYLDKFRLDNIGTTEKTNKQSKNIIKVTHHGIIKPIRFVNGDCSIVIDGTYIYYVNSSSTTVIAHWNDRDEIVESKEFISVFESELYKKVKANEQIIRKHKKYIAPYRLYSENIVKVK